jgi:hypothetical protein
VTSVPGPPAGPLRAAAEGESGEKSGAEGLSPSCLTT